MEKVLTILTIFWNKKEKTVIYQVETDAFSNVIIPFSKKNLLKMVSNYHNHIREELMLRLVVEYQNFLKDINQMLRFLILKIKEYFLGLLKRKNMFIHPQKSSLCYLEEE